MAHGRSTGKPSGSATSRTVYATLSARAVTAPTGTVDPQPMVSRRAPDARRARQGGQRQEHGPTVRRHLNARTPATGSMRDPVPIGLEPPRSPWPWAIYAPCHIGRRWSSPSPTRHGMQEVAGSSPASSTRRTPAMVGVSSFEESVRLTRALGLEAAGAEVAPSPGSASSRAWSSRVDTLPGTQRGDASARGLLPAPKLTSVDAVLSRSRAVSRRLPADACTPRRPRSPRTPRRGGRHEHPHPCGSTAGAAR